jgi:hypothetical protein
MSIWRTVGDVLSFGQVSRNERKEERKKREEARRAWEAIQGNLPSQMDLMGLSGMAGQTPQEYIDNYIRQHTNAGSAGASRGDPRLRPGTSGSHAGGGLSGTALGVSRQELEERARQQWLQEQVANDPWFGLQQYARPELADTQADPMAVEAQRRALQSMGDIYDQGGYTSAEREQIRMAEQQAASAEQAQREAVMQQAQMRGMGNSGAGLAGALAAQQGGANRSADWASQISIAGQQRALQALQNYGQQAGQMRSQSFGEDQTRRGALDHWNQSNTQLQNAWRQQWGNSAQQQFQNQANITAGITGQYNMEAAQHAQNQQNLTNNALAVGQAAANVYTGGAAGAATSAAQGS